MPTNGPLIDITDTLDAVRANWSHLEHNRLYTLKQLVGKERWLATPPSHRKQLGVEFKALAPGVLPLRWVDRRSDNSQVYQLR